MGAGVGGVGGQGERKGGDLYGEMTSILRRPYFTLSSCSQLGQEFRGERGRGGGRERERGKFSDLSISSIDNQSGGTAAILHTSF